MLTKYIYDQMSKIQKLGSLDHLPPFLKKDENIEWHTWITVSWFLEKDEIYFGNKMVQTP